jgi:hypothetical protein
LKLDFITESAKENQNDQEIGEIVVCVDDASSWNAVLGVERLRERDECRLSRFWLLAAISKSADMSWLNPGNL